MNSYADYILQNWDYSTRQNKTWILMSAAEFIDRVVAAAPKQPTEFILEATKEAVVYPLFFYNNPATIDSTHIGSVVWQR